MFGASFCSCTARPSSSRADDRLTVSLADGRRLSAAAVILASGASYRRLGVPSLEALTGAGVFYGGPASEAHALTGKDVYVAGGGNSAGQAALHLARYARRVTLVVRAESLAAGMSHYLVREVEATPNIDVRTGTEVVGGGGDGRLEQLVLRESAAGEETTVAADALFVLIGADPHTDWLPGEIARDRHGFLYTGEDLPAEHDWPLERRPFGARDEHAGRARGRRRPPRLGQARRVGGGRGLDRGAAAVPGLDPRPQDDFSADAGSAIWSNIRREPGAGEGTNFEGTRDDSGR